MKTVQAYARDAYDGVQYACNLSGVVFAFDQMLADLAAQGHDINDSPVVRLWTDKMDDLSRARTIKQPPATGHDLPSLAAYLASTMRLVCEEYADSERRNTHAAVQIITAQLAIMVGSREYPSIFEDYESCEKMALTTAPAVG